MKLKYILITSTLCLGLASCSSNPDYKQVGAGALGSAGGIALAHNFARGNNVAMAIGIIAGYMVGTALYDKMTRKDKATLANIIYRDIQDPNSVGRTGFWENPETNKQWQYKKISHNNNCSIFEVKVKDKNINWTLQEQHKACIDNFGKVNLV